MLTNVLVSELEDLPHAELAAQPGGELRVLCTPARDEFDGVMNRVLARELERRGIRATSASTDEFVSDTAARMEKHPVDLVFVSSVVPTHFLHVRSLCKRLLRARPDARIVLGSWGEGLSATGIAERLPVSPQVQPVSTLKEAIAVAQRLVHAAPQAPRLEPGQQSGAV